MKRCRANFQIILKTKVILLLSVLLLVGCNSKEGNDDVDDFLSIELGNPTGDGGIGNSALTFTPAAHDFGDVGIGGSGTQSFTITNTSSRSVFLSKFDGVNLTYSISTTTCPTGGTTALSAGGTCIVDIDFNPSSGGAHNLTINALYDLTSGAETLISPLPLQGSAGANAPSNYILSDIDGTTATISWTDNSNNEINFEVERCDGLACAGTFTAASTTVIASNLASHQFTGLTEGSYYRFRVRALTATSQSNWLEGPTVITFGGVDSIVDNGTGTADLTGLDCRKITSGAYITLDWNAVPDAINYFIFDISGGSNTLLKTVSAPETSTTITGLPQNSAVELLITVATNTGFNSQNTTSTNLTTTDYLPCLTLGKPNFNTKTDGSSFYFPSGAHIYGGKLFVADRLNNRILIWNALPTSSADKADIVIGQSSTSERYINNTLNSIGEVSAQSLYDPFHVWAGSVGGSDKMIISDYNNHRVLIWNSIPTSNHAPADIVLGQGNMTTRISDSADRTRGMQNPINAFSDGTKLFVSDFSNHRVLIWNTFPTSNFAKPDVYLGQANDTDQGFSCNADRMRNPRGLWADGTTLLVANNVCNRVSVYSPVPTGGNPLPITTLGNSSLTASGASAASTGVNRPWEVLMNAGKVYVSDHNNNRIKVWNSLPAAGNHGVASDYVVGLSNTANSGGTQQNRLDNPVGMAISGTSLYVADYDNHRITGYSTLPTGDATNASFQIGQSDFGVEVFNNSDPIAANNFDSSEGIAYDGTQFFAADVSRNRVLVWNGVPSADNQNAAFVIGQGNFSTITSGRSQSQLNAPRGICVGGGKLWVPDYNNRRVMMFDLPITTNAPNATGVLGQTAWNVATSNTGFDRTNLAIACHFDGTKFFVTDRTYDRILIWNTLPNLVSVTDNPPADVRIGGDTAGRTSQTELWDPNDVHSDGSRLYVADSNNHRIVVWDPIPTINDAPGAFYLGGNTSWTARNAGVTTTHLNYPVAVEGDGLGKLYVLDRSNERVLGFANPSFVNEAASEIYGKTLYTSTVESPDNSPSLSSDTRGLLKIDNRLFLGDLRDSRIIAFPIAP